MLAAQFVQKHLTNQVPLNDIDIASCEMTLGVGPSDTGFVLEGLATLSVLKNNTYGSLYVQMILTCEL